MASSQAEKSCEFSMRVRVPMSAMVKSPLISPLLKPLGHLADADKHGHSSCIFSGCKFLLLLACSGIVRTPSLIAAAFEQSTPS